MSKSISIIGILGGGQLGRMTAIAAEKLGIRTHIYTDERASPTEKIAYKTTIAPYDDAAALQKFAESVDVVSFEFENIPYKTLEILEKYVEVNPKPEVIKICQNRLREKDFVNSLGVGTAPYARVSNRDELEAAIRKIGKPSILKTTEMGYDGKGQVQIESLLQQIELKDGVEYVLEGFVHFEKEISVIVARGKDGEVKCYEPAENIHKNHILDITISPANISKELAQKARDIAMKIAEGLGLVGVLAVEMFVCGDEILVNELAPRPHNSGHHTIDSCITSQFEQFVRAICGLELGDVTQHSKAEMKNLIGDEIALAEKYAAEPDCFVHLYGKATAREGRKMAHVTKVGQESVVNSQ
ncbi:MAG: 5-(carboxyamino)imidazole ribonucleotide synthase [Alphaproteobacteria bacterium CG11_big_fil_rev_8_21_14_0_20_44_7]|nr:MAG: 5-(carboxyamino)imidazole ribonucleotide synthase [Alphaproteobacteria bacterium CG11_big_fil_rev_8_21_14_0_20_44_7]